MANILSQSVQKFLLQHIQSVEDLDVLMLVRSAPKKDWNASDVSESLSMDPISASNRLMGLYLQGLLTHPVGEGKLYRYRYQPHRTLEKLANELAACYDRYRTEVCDYVSQNQRGQMLAFAGAFRLSKEK